MPGIPDLKEDLLGDVIATRGVPLRAVASYPPLVPADQLGEGLFEIRRSQLHQLVVAPFPESFLGGGRAAERNHLGVGAINHVLY